MRCSKYGAEYSDGSKLCAECASLFVRRCRLRRAENPPIAKFCFEYAQPISVEAVAVKAKATSQHQARDVERRHLTVRFSDLVKSNEIAARQWLGWGPQTEVALLSNATLSAPSYERFLAHSPAL